MRPTSTALIGLLTTFLSLAAPQSPRAEAPTADPGLATWNAPVGTDPCGAELQLERLLRADPRLVQQRELYESLVREATRKGLMPHSAQAAGPSYVIPVVVHIVHQGGPENISDSQVLSQIHALNRDFADSLNGPAPSVNTQIQFCLATQLPPASPVVWSTTPGITRTFSSETNHTFANYPSEVALKAIDYLPSNKYLNIWVVKHIAGAGGGVAGYGTFPGTVPATLDGVVIRYTAFGSDYTPYGGPWPNLLPFNNDGKIMTHEVGHYLNLYHTFHGGCSVQGDFVADTPSEANARNGCPVSSLTSCTNVNDPIENFMDYTNDACRFAFTAGQATRMQSALSSFRSSLVSGQNLIDVGCDSGLNALIVRSRGQICTADTVTYTTPAAGAGWTYAWTFPGGVPASANTQTVTVVYPTAGSYPATLTVTDGFYGISTNAVQVYVRACAPISGPCRQWVFPSNASLDFGTGVPRPVAGRINVSAEPGAAVSDAAGNLLFYTDGVKAYDRLNAVMPNGTGLLAGISSHSGALILPRPGSSTQYFLFTVRQQEDNNQPNPMNYSIVDMTLNSGFGAIPTGQKNITVALPGSPIQLLEGMAAIPHCNGVDWWLVSHGVWTTNGKLFVTLVTNAGPVSTVAYNNGVSSPGLPLGMLTASRDGTRIAAVCYGGGQIGVWNFNRATGVPTTLLAPTGAFGSYSDVCFSPNGNLLYLNYFNGGYGVRQVDIATQQMREVFYGQSTAIAQGPDGLVYIGPATSPSLHCINYPDNFNTLDQNECGLNLNSVPLGAGVTDGPFGALPNMPLQCTTVRPADFTFTISNCLTVNLTSPNCTGPYAWNFGDATTGSGQTVSHTYAAPGTYTITLTVTGAVPATVQKTVTLGMQPVSIAGSAIVCDTLSINYSAIGPANYTYTWSTSGGVPTFGTGSSFDATWPLNFGVLTLVAYDSTTGCSTTLSKNIGACPTCVSPPANMTAWFPMDESSGTFALETVLGAHGVDVNGAVHTPGKVRRGRSLNGINQYVQANDAPSLNFGAGDLTIDAWVRTGTAVGIQPIVDKRTADPEQGYALYLKDGRLALRLADLTTSTEYWSMATPFVADGQWHHVAGSLNRAATSNGTQLFVDGMLVASFPAYTGGSVTNNQPLLLGAQAGFFGPQGYLSGAIDEVELFQRSLTTNDVNGLALADSMGKCKEFSWVPTIANICRDQGDVTLTMQVSNYTTLTQSYNVALSGIPSGGACTWAGPTSFQMITSMPVVVPANSSVPVQYKVFRPVGMPLYTTSCYQVTVTNTNTLATTFNRGSLYASRRWCNLIVKGPIGVGNSGSTARVILRATNTGDDPIVAPFTIGIPVSSDGSAETPVISLNGLPPGEPYRGDLVLAPNESQDLTIDAAFLEPRAFRVYDLVLSMDEDGDGLLDPLMTAGLQYGQTEPTLDVPTTPTVPHELQLGVTPNPVRSHAVLRYSLPMRGRIEVALYDVAGRQVLAVPTFTAEAGPGNVSLDCRSLVRGVYFVHMRVNGAGVGRRFLRLE